ncbi:MAG: GNAT family N-acetyltransferase [Acidobacteriota bacterium]|nr:GNAT family N-acetyltransferase [Acidobacteriota bacterium]
MFPEGLSIVKITSAKQREEALKVFDEVYRVEKGWVGDPEDLLPTSDLNRREVDWFGVELEGQMLGVTRVLYEIPMELYKEYGFKLTVPGLDVEEFIRKNKIAEVGRFAVLPEYRKGFTVAALLMRASGESALQRGFTHFITDVFEEDPNTPYGFHRRVLGFQEVASHEVGELNCKSRRITMLLDLNQARERVAKGKGWFFRFLNQAKLPEMVN